MPPRAAVEAGCVTVDGTGRTRSHLLHDLDRTADAVFDGTAYGAEDAQDLIAARSRFGTAVIASSAIVYADAAGRALDQAGENGFPQFEGPIGEDTATVPPGAAIYSTRKVAMEQALFDAGVPTTALRPCAVYGTSATHPREWWFIKRALDGRSRIPVAYGAESVFHTSSARGIASLAALCMASPGARVLNVADAEALSVRDIAGAIADATGLELKLAPFDGPPIGPSQIGATPWSAERPFVLDTSRAQAMGWTPPDYGQAVREVCDWILKVGRTGDWRRQFTRFARYGYDPFDYDAEDRFLADR